MTKPCRPLSGGDADDNARSATRRRRTATLALRAPCARVGDSGNTAAAWQWLAPTQFGGQTTYALVTGSPWSPPWQVARWWWHGAGSPTTPDRLSFDAKGGHTVAPHRGGRCGCWVAYEGDNNNWWDPWEVANPMYAGRRSGSSRPGAVLSWFIARPAPAAAFAAAGGTGVRPAAEAPSKGHAVSRSRPAAKHTARQASTSARQASGSGCSRPACSGRSSRHSGRQFWPWSEDPRWPNLVLAVAGLTICSVATLVVNRVARFRWHPIAGHDEELASLDSARIWPHTRSLPMNVSPPDTGLASFTPRLN